MLAGVNSLGGQSLLPKNNRADKETLPLSSYHYEVLWSNWLPKITQECGGRLLHLRPVRGRKP